MKNEFEIEYEPQIKWLTPNDDDPADLVRWGKNHWGHVVKVFRKGSYVGKVCIHVQNVDGKPTIMAEVQNKNEEICK
jgi:hypothetical protein